MLNRAIDTLAAAAFVCFLQGFGFAIWLASTQTHHDHYAQNSEQPRAPSEDAQPPTTAASQDHPTNGSEHEEYCRYNGPKWFAGFYCFFALNEKFWVSFG